MVAVEPVADLWMLVDGVVVEDDVDEFAGRYLRLDGVDASAACCGRA